MDEGMKRGRSQIIWRYMPNSTFRYNEYQAWCKVTDVKLENESNLDGALADTLKNRLDLWNALGYTGYPDPTTQASKYRVGEPSWVEYELYPLVFQCKECKRIQYTSTVNKLKNNPTCWTCKGKLKQVPYAFIHECGNIDTLFVPKCPKNSSHSVGLHDKNNFLDSFWYCLSCGTKLSRGPRAGLGVRGCSCGKTMRGVILIDPRVYYSQTVALIDFQSELLNIWQSNSNYNLFLKGALLRIPSHKRSHLYDLAKSISGTDTLSQEMKTVKEQLKQSGMSDQQIDEIISSTIKKTSDPWFKYKRDLESFSTYTSNYHPSDNRQSLEYIFVRDDPKIMNITLDSIIQEAVHNNDSTQKSKIENDKLLANSLGLINLGIIQNLPILLAGIGYTRYFANPIGVDGTNDNIKLNPYTTDSKGRIPIYTARNSTEAFLYELDPWRLAAFIEMNSDLEIPPEVKLNEIGLRAWLWNILEPLYMLGESYFKLFKFEEDKGIQVDVINALVFGVLHTISHALISTAHQYVGIDKDSLSEYLFPSHLSGLLYVSSHVEFTLGGIDAVFKSNLSQWLGSMRDFANVCSFDPVCNESGGACMACLYTKFGCSYFNRNLSRSYLFGGKISDYDREIIGFWSADVTNRINELKDQNNNV